ncbi:hypothetical protein LTR15_004737 [Elasticomyces elasticus]|nr:hypothetical protein LTR15_004737 [Elasticomyces elasticus]
MQSMFRLPWSSDQIAPKMQAGKPAMDSMRASPVMDMTMLNKLKRKRTDSPEPFSSALLQPTKKARGDQEVFRQSPTVTPRPLVKIELRQDLPVADLQPNPTGASQQIRPTSVTHPSLYHQQAHRYGPILPDIRTTELKVGPRPSQQPLASHMSRDVTMIDAPAPVKVQAQSLDMSPLKQAIENEFNMQILLKHNELRLIEQELSKCQIALEQLRRCELRPFPGAQQLSSSVSAGTGPSIAPLPGYTQPSHAAPYGVTDGPYASHYRQWLLRDPQFDPASKHATSFAEPDARSTRNVGGARKSIQKSFAVPSATSAAPRSTPNNSNKKNKMAFLKRASDGQMVKLVCNHCHRSDFSNAQGFLNHCRIAHKLDYKSQEQAAIDCGQLLDEAELAMVPPDALNISTHKPSASRSAASTNTPFRASNYVHPMNVSGALPMGTITPAQHNRAPARPRAIAPASITPVRTSNAPFASSSQAPRLSAQFAKYNLGGNLEQAISNARQKVDLSAEEALSPDVLESASPLAPAVGGARMVMGTSRAGSLAPQGGAVERPSSRKGFRPSGARPRPSPLMQTSGHAGNGSLLPIQPSSESPHSPHDRSSVNLSPHTVESNPGMVSDHEDDEDHGSVMSEDHLPQQAAIAHSLGMRSSGCGGESMDIDVRVDDDMDEHGVVIERSSMLSGDAGGSSRDMEKGRQGA